MFNENQPSFQHLAKIYAENSRDIIFWVGAGLSTPAGLPSWHRLRDILLDAAKEKLSTIAGPEIGEYEDILERLPNLPSLWDAFEDLKTVLGPTEFRTSISTILEAAEKADVPPLYRAIWKLENVKGMLTLNVDGFAKRSHREVRNSETEVSFTGNVAGRYVKYLNQRKTVIANLHGELTNPESWIFTRSEITNLKASNAYVTFINTILTSFSVVFIGISADDTAVGGFLADLKSYGVDPADHFWITDRNDFATDRWAASSNISRISYSLPKSGNATLEHEAAIIDIFKRLKDFVSVDSKAPTVLGSIAEQATKITPKEMLQLNTDDEIRMSLAAHAISILSKNNNNTNSSEYREFLTAYARPIRLAWSVSNKEPSDIFLGRKVTKLVSQTPFASVWKLVDQNGVSQALKIMHMENLESGPQIDSFRRGVQSMKYLANHNISGAVKIIDAMEIPTCVIMEFVEGENLADLARNSEFDFWGDGTQILLNIATLIEKSHSLSERVLHRDIRPSNIMVPRYFWSDDIDEDNSRLDVVMLNYDMSWHVGASGKSLSGNLDEIGYYAPEQLGRSDHSSARSTLVDSYGLGMTIYFALTRIAPPSGGSKSVDWPELLLKSVRAEQKLAWKSLPYRLNWLIRRATEIDYSKRLSIREIRSTLQQIRFAISSRYGDLSMDFLAEELFFGVFGRPGTSNASGSIFSLELKPGRVVVVDSVPSENRLRITYKNAQVAGDNWTNIDKKWSDKLKQCREKLERIGWEIDESTTYSGRQIILQTTIRVDDWIEEIYNNTKKTSQAIDLIRLD